VTKTHNQLDLSAAIIKANALRFTPAGLPALDFHLEHEASLEEAGQIRLVRASTKAVAFGALAESLARQAIGSVWHFRGFVASPRNSNSLVFHVQEFSKD